MKVRLFHRTTEAAAAAILADGFRDAEGSYGLATLTLKGVFVSDVPLDAGQGGVVSGDGTALLAIEGLELAEIEDYELVEDGKPYREWCIPAARINGAGVVRRATAEEGS